MAALATYLTFSTKMPTWVLFLAWTSYFLLGGNIKSCVLTFIQQVLGILIAIVIIYCGNSLAQSLGSLWFHCSVTVIMFGVFYLSKLRVLNNLSAYFLGMIVWFGLGVNPTLGEIFEASISLLIGYSFGFTNEFLNNKTAKRFSQ